MAFLSTMPNFLHTDQVFQFMLCVPCRDVAITSSMSYFVRSASFSRSSLNREFEEKTIRYASERDSTEYPGYRSGELSILGYAVESRSDAYRIVFSSNSRLSEDLLNEALRTKYDIDEVIATSLQGTHNINWKTWSVCKKFGIVERKAIYERKSARFLCERYYKTPVVREALRELYHDKFDIPGTKKIIELVRLGKMPLIWTEIKKFSSLAEPILDHASKYYSAPASIDSAVLDQIKKRLEKTTIRLVCARCGKWDRTMDLLQARQKRRLSCPYCRCSQITSTFQSDTDLGKIIKKKQAGKRLSSEEKHKFDRAWKASSLVENFGATALTVLSGYGIGPDTAARILRNMVDENGDGLYRQIYEAERQYVMTRGFS